MTTIGKDTDLVDATVDTVDWTQHGWETCTASAFNVVIYTYNQGAAYSDDSGDTFHVMDANGLCSAYGKTLSGDQVVTYEHDQHKMSKNRINSLDTLGYVKMKYGTTVAELEEAHGLIEQAVKATPGDEDFMAHLLEVTTRLKDLIEMAARE